jgi:outer membrane lipoprotein-sorting protein
MKRHVIAVLALVGLVLAGCGSQDKAAEKSGGAVEGKAGNIASVKKGGTQTYANISITVPADWEVSEEENLVRVYSPGDTVLLQIEEFSSESWKDYVAKAEKKMTEYLKNDLGSEYKVSKKGEEKINGINTYYFNYSYEDPDYGKAICYTYAVETGKGITMLTFDVLEEGLNDYKKAMGDIKASLAVK